MKPRSWAVFLGTAGLLLITLGAGPALVRTATLGDTSATVNHGLGNVSDPSAPSGASVDAAQLTPKRVGPGPVIPHGAKRIGALGASTSIDVDVMLAPRSAAALEDYAANVSSPGNSLYHHYLTVGQFASMFGPTDAAISTVEASLRADGLTPGPLSADHLMLPVTATAGQFGKAFSTGFDQYRLSGGRIAFANTTAPWSREPLPGTSRPSSASTASQGHSLSEVSCTSGCARHANVFTWTLAALASGASAQFSITVKAHAAGRVLVLAWAASQSPDPNPRNNISIQRITIGHRQGPGRGRWPWPPGPDAH